MASVFHELIRWDIIGDNTFASAEGDRTSAAIRQHFPIYSIYFKEITAAIGKFIAEDMRDYLVGGWNHV